MYVAYTRQVIARCAGFEWSWSVMDSENALHYCTLQILHYITFHINCVANHPRNAYDRIVQSFLAATKSNLLLLPR